MQVRVNKYTFNSYNVNYVVYLGTHNKSYLSQRRERLTASVFGSVCKRRTDTSCHVLVKSILYPKHITSAALEYGKVNEIVARQIFSEKTNNTVKESGLFVDTEHGFLGASPDGWYLRA